MCSQRACESAKASPLIRPSLYPALPSQCRAVAHEFLGCIESNKRDYSACKDLSKAYLQCRMDKVRVVVWCRWMGCERDMCDSCSSDEQ